MSRVRTPSPALEHTTKAPDSARGPAPSSFGAVRAGTRSERVGEAALLARHRREHAVAPRAHPARRPRPPARPRARPPGRPTTPARSGARRRASSATRGGRRARRPRAPPIRGRRRSSARRLVGSSNRRTRGATTRACAMASRAGPPHVDHLLPRERRRQLGAHQQHQAREADEHGAAVRLQEPIALADHVRLGGGGLASGGGRHGGGRRAERPRPGRRCSVASTALDARSWHGVGQWRRATRRGCGGGGGIG